MRNAETSDSLARLACKFVGGAEYAEVSLHLLLGRNGIEEAHDSFLHIPEEISNIREP